MNSIAATATRTGLKVHAELDLGTYDTGIKVTDRDIDALPMDRHCFHGDWNYTLHPRPATPQAQSTTRGQPTARPRSAALGVCATRS